MCKGKETGVLHRQTLLYYICCFFLLILCPVNGREINPKMLQKFPSLTKLISVEVETPKIFIPSSVMPAHEKLYKEYLVSEIN